MSRVLVGDAKRLELPALGHERRGGGRLKGLRWVATSFRPDDPSREDLNALVRGRLDLYLQIHVERQPEGGSQAGALREVHLEPVSDGAEQGYVIGPPRPPSEPRNDLRVFLAELEGRFEEATPAARELVEGERHRPAVLAVVAAKKKGPHDPVEEELAELRALAFAAGLDVRGEVVQRRARMDPHTLLGKGRVRDLAALAMTVDAGLAVINEDLAPRQQLALEKALGIEVIDRTQLILDLFAGRARTHAGKLQVEVARLRYMLPRLLGRGDAMSRVGGGKGAGFGRTKGAGEKKLEIDRRRIRDRIAAVERELGGVRRQSALRRRRRQKNALPHVALVGYTNVGKSTLFNRLTESSVLAKDMLFASLDPTLRQRRLPGGRRVVFSDTVGFIRRLPPALVEAFRATLDELEDASLILHVADASDPHVLERVEAVEGLLSSLGHGERPRLLVFNKIDRVDDPELFRPLAISLTGDGPPPLLISAQEGSMDELLAAVEASLGPGHPATMRAVSPQSH